MSRAMGRLLSIIWVFALLAGQAHASDGPSMMLTGATVYASPTASPIADALVLISGGMITAVGKRSDVQVPIDTQVIDCTGKTVVAGFWNSHVHFTGPQWLRADSAPAGQLTLRMQEMLTRWGFTTVWDLGSVPQNSLSLRARVESGEVAGPKILLAPNFFPKGGHPIYVPADVEVPEPGTPGEMTNLVSEAFGMGSDGVKLFTGSFRGPKPVVNMDPAVAKAAVDVAHARGRPVFAHPQNKAGVDIVLATHVDVMAHTVPAQHNYSEEQLSLARAEGTALIPTLTLWTTAPLLASSMVDAGVLQLKTFSDNGGTILFGTDVGFTKIVDTTLELELMGRALSASQVLAALTTNPAGFFHAARKGRVEVGMDADLVVLDGDPAADVRNLAKVGMTIRAGRIIYQKP
ncbi:MAG: amidohydrolase family protein [Tardiphaga sp.]|nr:amidohydrolase family protein [Tardiphaga sp.]